VKVYSIALFLGPAISLALLAVRAAVVHHTPKGTCMVARVLRRAPYAGDAELAAATILIVVWAVKPPPSVASTDFYAPALRFGVPESVLDLLLRMRRTGHQ
jgi:hypothetical protein